MKRTEREALLLVLADRLIISLVSSSLGIREGAVMSLAGSPPYRRLDCDGKALCYIRCRPMKRAVRVDLSGLWCRPASGAATLMLASFEEVEDAARYLRSVVTVTRQR
jgi:hypothetical protein